eukprot:m.112761 g.112761  ORF g.112761 m.112761 type:complete len:53 (-) comp13487_c0_seq3:1740-1898(-)
MQIIMVDFEFNTISITHKTMHSTTWTCSSLKLLPNAQVYVYVYEYVHVYVYV